MLMFTRKPQSRWKYKQMVIMKAVVLCGISSLCRKYGQLGLTRV
jgi:hypothetical protein